VLENMKRRFKMKMNYALHSILSVFLKNNPRDYSSVGRYIAVYRGLGSNSRFTIYSF